MPKLILSFSAILISCVSSHNACSQERYVERMVDSLLSEMTLDEKISLLSGHKGFYTKGVERLNIPPVLMSDGPMGIKGHGKSTAFPANICMASTWNPELINKVGISLGKEARAKGIGILLAPGVNIYRIPHCGRNFEYFGEDPFLTSKLAVAFIKGVQSQHVMATVKHFAANNQELDRHRISSNVDERTLNEIYFPAFRAAVMEANVGGVMTSYNPVNGIHASESSFLINETLRHKWGFKGIVISDWISVYSTNAFKAGVDIEMPRPQFFSKDSIHYLIRSDPANMFILDKKVKTILETLFRYHLTGKTANAASLVDSAPNTMIARQVAREGMVLLKNENNLLPISGKSISTLAVIGPHADYTPFSGGGSAMVDAHRMVSFYEGIKANAPRHVKVDLISSEGFQYTYSGFHTNKFSNETLARLKEYDAVVLCLGFNPDTEGEGFDRPFSLPYKQEKLIDMVCKTNRNVILVVNAGGGIFMPWIHQVKCLLYAWYSGEESGNALAEILLGKVNPSGKLPISIEKYWMDNACYPSYDTSGIVPSAKPFYTLYGKRHEIKNLEYDEGIFLGYRHFDTNNKKPLFPFGFGLSYTTFELSDLSVSKKNLETVNDSLHMVLKVKNTGKYDGAEVVQLYIRDVESSIPRPFKELKAFRKVYLEKGQNTVVRFSLKKEMLSFYNPEIHDWVTEKGDFEILIGTSSGNILLKECITLQ